MTRLEEQRRQNKHERIVYQPEYDEELWQDTGFCSFMAFRTQDECRRVFPTLDPVRYDENDIEDLTIVSTDDFRREEITPMANEPIREVVVIVERGLVQHVDAPEGVRVVVKDYDIAPGSKHESIQTDPDGGRYTEQTWAPAK